MIDIGKRAQKLIPALMKGKENGYGAVDAKIECKDEWSKDYAIIQDVDYEPMADEQPYFDRDEWQRDMERIAEEVMFKGCNEETVWLRGTTSVKVTRETPKKKVYQKWVKPGAIVVHFHGYPTHELEIYRAELPPKPKKPDKCPKSCKHGTFHYCGAAGTHCDKHCVCPCHQCKPAKRKKS